MARVLIVGDADRALLLAGELDARGHPTRIVARDRSREKEVEAAGAELWVGDPNRLGTITSALDSVTVACWLLADDEDKELHGGRLEAFLGKAIDSTMRGFVYESSGAAPEETLARGVKVATAIAQRNEIPLQLLEADPSDPGRWLTAALEAVERLLSPA